MLKSTHWSILNKLLPILYGFIPLFIIVRKVTPDELGEFFYFTLIVTTFFQLSNFNAKNIFINKVVILKGGFYKVFYSTYNLFRFFLFIITLCILILESYTYIDKKLIILSLIFYMLSYSQCQEWLLESRYEQRRLFTVKLATSTFFFLIKIPLDLADNYCIIRT